MPTETILRENLRTFHLTGLFPGETVSEDALRPTVLAKTDLPALQTFYPMCISPGGSARPLRELTGELEHAQNITSAFLAAMKDRPSAPVEAVAPEAIESLKECSSAEISRLRKLLPDGATLLNFDSAALLLLHAAALAEARQPHRTRFWNDVRRTTERLREMLAVDRSHSPDALSAESVSATLGSRVASFFNPSLLAKALQRPANPLRTMEPERLLRCENTLMTLIEALHDSASDPAFFLFQPDDAASVDNFAAALEFCDARLARLTKLLRALRVARLELDSAFDPRIHEEMLARYDWQSATAEELMATPPIVVWETAGRLAEVSLTSFGKLLRSGRPVQILIARTSLAARDLTEFSPDFGFLSIAHREAFVLESSLAQPSHLLAGLDAMAKKQRTAVAVVSTPRDRDAWLVETLVVLSRTHALYTYDPDAGARWSERFRLFVPPATEVSPAHAAAVTEELRRNFRIVPASEWNSDQMELAEYLGACQTHAPLAIPFIWVEGPDGAGQRALLTRDLANFCADRRRAWELFEELSGAGKREAAPAISTDDARKEGAHEAIQQVIAMLKPARNTDFSL